MCEKWIKAPSQALLDQDETVYHVTRETTVRSVQRTRLIREKERLQLEIEAIDADLAKINELQVAEGEAE